MLFVAAGGLEEFQGISNLCAISLCAESRLVEGHAEDCQRQALAFPERPHDAGIAIVERHTDSDHREQRTIAALFEVTDVPGRQTRLDDPVGIEESERATRRAIEQVRGVGDEILLLLRQSKRK
jgi:hypothetical protein